MAFLNRRPTVIPTTSTSSPSSSNTGHSQVSSPNASHGHLSAANNAQLQRGDSHSLMKRVSTMFTPKKKPFQAAYNDGQEQRTGTGAGAGVGVGIGFEMPRQKSKSSTSKSKLNKSRRTSMHSLGVSSDSDTEEDMDEIRQPNDLGPPAPSIYSSVPEEAEEEEEDRGPLYSLQRATLPKPKSQKHQRRVSMQSIQSLLSASQASQHNPSEHSSSHSKRRSFSASLRSSFHSKNSSLHSRNYSHSLHSLSQSLLEEEAELIEDPVFTATKATKVSAVWAGPTRTTSAPNLVSLLPLNPSFSLSIRRKPPPRLGLREVPLQVLTRVFEFLPRRLVLCLALLSKPFCKAAQMVIYGTLDLRHTSSVRQETLNMFLAGRKDLTEITRVLICETQSSSSLYPPIFPAPLVLAQMHHLTSITMHCFSIELLQHHSAFGLRSVTFLNTHLTNTEKFELLTWLDGQVNITTLNFPRLVDPPKIEAESEGTTFPTYPSTHFPLPPSPNPSLSLSPYSTSSPSLLPPSPFSIPLPPSPNPSLSPFPSSPFPSSPSHANFPAELEMTINALGSSETLLPHLHTLRASPSLLQLLAPSRARTLREVGVNIDDTLFGGLRPAELVGFLKPSSGSGASESASTEDANADEDEDERSTRLETLQLIFGKSVDRRTVEKVLAAAGSVLGGDPSSGQEEIRGRTGRGRKGRVGESDHHHDDGDDEVENENGNGRTSRSGDERPSGLENLEVAVPWMGPRTPETLYKTVHAVLPRYRALSTLVMRLSDDESNESEQEVGQTDVQVSEDGTTSQLQEQASTLPALRVNGEIDPEEISAEGSAEAESRDGHPRSSQSEHSHEHEQETTEGGNGRNTSPIHALKKKISRMSLATTSSQLSGETPSIVSLTMFPEPPALPPPASLVRPISVYSTKSAEPNTNTQTSSVADTDTVSASPTATASTSSPSELYSESSTPTLISASPTSATSTSRTKALLGRLPSLKRRAPKRAESDPVPVPPVPNIKTQLDPNANERSSTLPVPIPISPLTPTTPTQYSPGLSTAVPRTPNTPSTPRMSRTPTPSTPSTPRYSHFAHAQQLKLTTAAEKDDRRISTMTALSGFSTSSSMRGVDWNHGNGDTGNGDSSNGSGPSTPLTPRTPVPETPTKILTESEKRHVRMWIRQCPTLRRVVFVSGAEWGL